MVVVVVVMVLSCGGGDAWQYYLVLLVLGCGRRGGLVPGCDGSRVVNVVRAWWW